jgi:hypothetical protein
MTRLSFGVLAAALFAAATCAGCVRAPRTTIIEAVATNGRTFKGGNLYAANDQIFEAVKESGTSDLGCARPAVTVGYVKRYRGGEYTVDGCGYRAVYSIADEDRKVSSFDGGERVEVLYRHRVILMGRFSLSPPAPAAPPPPAPPP